MTTAKAKTSKSFPKSTAGGKSSASITHERLEQDIAEFEKSGGKIEKLGNTNVFKKIR